MTARSQDCINNDDDNGGIIAMIQRTTPQWNKLKNPYIETIRLMYIPVGDMLVRKAIADGIMKLYQEQDKSADEYNIYTFDWNKHNPFLRAEQQRYAAVQLAETFLTIAKQR